MFLAKRKKEKSFGLCSFGLKEGVVKCESNEALGKEDGGKLFLGFSTAHLYAPLPSRLVLSLSPPPSLPPQSHSLSITSQLFLLSSSTPSGAGM